jgi:hypothetical protein
VRYVLQWASTLVFVKSKTSNRICGTRGRGRGGWKIPSHANEAGVYACGVCVWCVILGVFVCLWALGEERGIVRTARAASHVRFASNLYCILHTILCEPKLPPQQSNGASQLFQGHRGQVTQTIAVQPLVDKQLLLQR